MYPRQKRNLHARKKRLYPRRAKKAAPYTKRRKRYTLDTLGVLKKGSTPEEKEKKVAPKD